MKVHHPVAPSTFLSLFGSAFVDSRCPIGCRWVKVALAAGEDGEDAVDAVDAVNASDGQKTATDADVLTVEQPGRVTG